MSCYSCGGNPGTWCQQCMPAEDTWIAPVDKLPDVFMGDRDHLYMTPNGNFYALSPDRTKWIQVNGQGGANFLAGDGIRIDGTTIINTKPNKDQTLSVNDHALTISDGNTVNLPNDKQNLNLNGRTLEISNGNSVTLPSDTQTLSINGRTVTISGGNSITLPEDKDTIYNDADLKRRIEAVENRTDNFVSGVGVSRDGDKVKLTYTFVNGDSKEVEFDDHDTKAVAYDDTALKERVKALEDKPAPVAKNQQLSISGNDLTISDGNTITLPIPVEQAPVQVEADNGLTATKQGNKYTVSGKALLDRVSALENKPQKADQTLNLNNRNLSISGGNTVALPNDIQSLALDGNKLSLNKGGNSITLPVANYKVSGNGLKLNNDTFSLDLGMNKLVEYPYAQREPIQLTKAIRGREAGFEEEYKKFYYQVPNIYTGDKKSALTVFKLTYYYIVDYLDPFTGKSIYDIAPGETISDARFTQTQVFTITTDKTSEDSSFFMKLRDDVNLDGRVSFKWNSAGQVEVGIAGNLVYTPHNDNEAVTFIHKLTQEDIESGNYGINIYEQKGDKAIRGFCQVVLGQFKFELLGTQGYTVTGSNPAQKLDWRN